MQCNVQVSAVFAATVCLICNICNIDTRFLTTHCMQLSGTAHALSCHSKANGSDARKGWGGPKWAAESGPEQRAAHANCELVLLHQAAGQTGVGLHLTPLSLSGSQESERIRARGRQRRRVSRRRCRRSDGGEDQRRVRG